MWVKVSLLRGNAQDYIVENMYQFENIIVFEESIKDELTKRITDKLSSLNIQTIDNLQKSSNNPILNSKKTLILRRNNGKFIKRCPGTKHFVCCNYFVINNVMGCPIDCSYCVLESYLDYRAITIFTNTDDIYSELKEFVRDKKNFRIGTGELSDSLALDDITLASTDIILHLGDNFNGFFEFKTKSNNIGNLLNLKPNKKIVIGFSLNTDRMVGEFEKNSASLGERINSAKILSEYGYSISIHFDPIIIYEESEKEKEYTEVIDLLFGKIKKMESIAWISIGAFRYSNELKRQIKVTSSNLLSGEFVKSLDGKYRYFKPLRLSIYSEIVDRIKSYYKEIPIYFCMESNDVWENVFGSKPSSIENLKTIF